MIYLNLIFIPINTFIMSQSSGLLAAVNGFAVLLNLAVVAARLYTVG